MSCFVILFMVLLFSYLNSSFGDYSLDKKAELMELRSLKVNHEYIADYSNHEDLKIRLYYSYVKSAKFNFSKQQIDYAILNFVMARDYIDNGKEANLGLACCYLYKCKHDFTYCDIANEYYAALMNSKILTDTEQKTLQENI